MWVAPNLITMVGLIVNVFTSLLVIYFCPTATEPVSSHIRITILANLHRFASPLFARTRC
jgi:hypothetical protein